MAAQPQQAVTNIQPQPVVVLQEQQFHQSPNNSYKRIINGLAIAEVILGSVSLILGIAALAIGIPYFYVFTLGEGIWCSVWIVVAGALGIPSAKVNSTRCLIACHLAFSVFGTLVAAVMFSFGVIGILGSLSSGEVAINSLMALAYISAMVLLIISASYSGLSLGCCCQGQMYQGVPQGPVIYAQQPITGQGASGSQTGYTEQGYQQIAPTDLNVVPQTSMMQQPAQSKEVAQNSSVQYPEKQQEALEQA